MNTRGDERLLKVNYVKLEKEGLKQRNNITSMFIVRLQWRVSYTKVLADKNRVTEPAQQCWNEAVKSA